MEQTIDGFSLATELPSEFKDALLKRLEFRVKFLTTVEMAGSRSSPELKAMWTELLAFIPKLKSSAVLGKPVPSSFSVKLQRKLASTVPPRPIVQVSQDTAFNHLENLCRDASIAVEVLEYHDSQSLLASIQKFRLQFCVNANTLYRRLCSYSKQENLNHLCIFVP